MSIVVLVDGESLPASTPFEAWELAVENASEDRVVLIADDQTGEVLTEVFIEDQTLIEPIWGVV